MHLVSCYIITAYIYGRDISWSVFFSTREMNIALLDVDGFQTWFGSVQFSSFCFWEHRVTLYSLCFKGEFQRYFEGFYVCFTYLSRTKKYLCARSQLSTRNKTLQLIRFTRRTETTTDLKSALAKQPLRCEANYQRKIYYSIKLKNLSLQRQLQIKLNLSMRPSILWSTVYPVLTQAIFREISWPQYWPVLLNK